MTVPVRTAPSRFLSTPSARRATVSPISVFVQTFNFYPRPPRGGRPFVGRRRVKRKIFLSPPTAWRATAVAVPTCRRGRISIHALREEGDITCIIGTRQTTKISIHALREEGDLHGLGGLPEIAKDFYPRPPRGGRPYWYGAGTGKADFYPRPPRGGRRISFVA